MANPVPQYQYISVFGEKTTLQADFETNGLAILCPTKCDVIEELNGSYSLTMEHPIDKNGIYKSVQIFRILKVQGQLFTIMNVEPNYTGRSGKITVYAEHIFYKQNDQWIYPTHIIYGNTGQEVLDYLRDNSFPNESDLSFPYKFSFSSDVNPLSTMSEELKDGKTRSQCIFDYMNKYGGELYRDNLYYSIRSRMENAQDYAFDIRIGLNLKGIKRTVDMTNFCTHFRGYDNLGNEFSVSYSNSSFENLPVPNIIVRSKNFSYQTEDIEEARAMLKTDVMNYFSNNLAPKITYTVQLRDVKNNPDYQEYYGIRYKVGDKGRVFDERLGGSMEMKIIKTKTDGITGEVTEVTFGDITSFIFEGNHIPVPEFPLPSYDEGKIAVIQLDENLNETDIITYFYNIADTNSYLKNNSDVNYAVYIGRDAGIESIGSSAFKDRTNLISIVIPESVTSIGANAFYGCTGLKTVDIQGEIPEIANSTFYRCISLEEINLPETVTSIGDSAFHMCSSLSNINLTDNINYIGTSAFYQTGITQVCLHNGSLTLGASAFSGCQMLKSVSVRCASAGNNVFQNCVALISAVYDGESVTLNMFRGCTSLNTISLGSNIREIGNYAFRNCESLISIDFPDSVETIGQDVVYDCTSLTSLSVGSGIQRINLYAFRHATALTSVSIGVPEDSIPNYPWGVSHKEIISWG